MPPSSVVDADSDLARVRELLTRMFALVEEGLAAASEAFLGGDRDMARGVVAGDRHLDGLQTELERLVEHKLLAAEHLDGRTVRELIAVLRIAPELERCGDLIEHIALRTPQGLSALITPRGRGLLGEMARTDAVMWRRVADAYLGDDPTAAIDLRVCDDGLDELHVELIEELARGDYALPVAIEMGLIARFYERLGDHAVNVARRIVRGTDG
jgi:phosphate transport system protein